MVKIFGLDIKLSIKEIIALSVLFTALAIYMNIHEEKIVYDFLADHIVALGLALIISRIIYEVFQKRR